MGGRTCGADRLSRLVGSGTRVRAAVSIRLRARQRTTALSVLEGLNHELEATSHPHPTRRVASSRPPIHQRARVAAQPHHWQRSRRQSGAPASIATRSAQSCIGAENADSSAAMDSLIRYRITAGGQTPSSNGSNSISATSLRPTCASSNLARPRDHRPSFRRGSFLCSVAESSRSVRCFQRYDSVRCVLCQLLCVFHDDRGDGQARYRRRILVSRMVDHPNP